MTGVLIKRGDLDIDMHVGECHVNMKAEIRVTRVSAKEHQSLSANHPELGERHGTDLPS